MTTVSASCPGCCEKTPHRLVFENKEIRHFRCDLCQGIQVCAYKTSVLSEFRALDFAAVRESAQRPDTPAYRAGDAFHPADLFEHPKFGTGYVLAVLSPPKKMEVLFADKARVLVCGVGSGVPKTPDPKPEKKPPAKRRARSQAKRREETPAETPMGQVARPCPKCGTTVHPYNMYHNPAGAVISCMHCK